MYVLTGIEVSMKKFKTLLEACLYKNKHGGRLTVIDKQWVVE